MIKVLAHDKEKCRDIFSFIKFPIQRAQDFDVKWVKARPEMTGSRAEKNSRRAENHSVSAGSFHFEKAVLVDQSRLLASFVFIINLFILNGISGIKQGKMRIDSFSHSTV